MFFIYLLFAYFIITFSQLVIWLYLFLMIDVANN